MTTFKTNNLSMTLDDRGYFTEVCVQGENILKKACPMLIVLKNDALFYPVKALQKEHEITLTMQDNALVVLHFTNTDNTLLLTVKQIEKEAFGVVFSPFTVSLDQTIGDVIGVVQGEKLAFSMMSANRKTLEGVPNAYKKQFESIMPYKQTKTNISVDEFSPSERAATALQEGAVLQMHCIRRDTFRYGEVMGMKNVPIVPLKEGDEDAKIEGASVLYFGCKKEDALFTIGCAEQENCLPHPMLKGEWVKTSRHAMRSYLISDFSQDEVDLVLDSAQKAGMDTIYHAEPFKTWGHFEWMDFLAKDDVDFKENVVDKAKARNMKVGVHTLTNFTTTNDSYVTPVPHEHLVKITNAPLLEDITEESDSVKVPFDALFLETFTLNACVVENEIFTFSSAQKVHNDILLKDVQRGAFGTKKDAHKKGALCQLLRDHPYRIFFPDIQLQDAFTSRLVQLFNTTGLEQISYDGYEGCCYTGHELYAPTRFLTNCQNGYDHFVLNDGSRLHHYSWHMHTRMNWGEPWGEEMREGQVKTRILNQDFYKRNLFPRMLGWYLIRLSDRRFECTTREDMEWALSKSAGFDAGYALSVNPHVLKKHGRMEEILETVKAWDTLRFLNVFSDAEKKELQNPQNEYRLTKQEEKHYSLSKISITKPYTCALSEMQPGQQGGADFMVENTLSPSFAFRMRILGDGEVRNPIFMGKKGSIKFPCTIKDTEYLLYDLNGTCKVTDKNYNEIKTVTPVGHLALDQGVSNLSFSLEHDRTEKPDVILRFMFKGEDKEIHI